MSAASDLEKAREVLGYLETRYPALFDALAGDVAAALASIREERDAEVEGLRHELRGACIIVAQLVARLGGEVVLPRGESIAFAGKLESSPTMDGGLRLRHIAPPAPPAQEGK